MALLTTKHHFSVKKPTFLWTALLLPVLLVMTGAEIVVKSKQTSISANTTTTSSGDFSLPTLDPGDYSVTITANGFQKLVQENVHVNALETQTLNPKLTVGATSEEVTVSAAPPQLETTNATLGATMEQEMYSALPIEM